MTINLAIVYAKAIQNTHAIAPSLVSKSNRTSNLFTGNCIMPQIAYTQQVPQHNEDDQSISTGLYTENEKNIKAQEISLYEHEIYAGDELIAKITHDDNDFVTQRWVVTINDIEIHRANTWIKCYNHITWHYTQGTLPQQHQEAETVTSSNEVAAIIADECEKFEFDIFDDGIYKNDAKLGQVGCTDGKWWVIKASSSSNHFRHFGSAFDAVWSLWAAEISSSVDENSFRTGCPKDMELLDLPFELLATTEWQLIKKHKPLQELASA